MEEKWNCIDFLELKPDRYLYELQKELQIYQVPLQITQEQIATMFQSTIAIDTEEISDLKETSRGKVYVKRDKTGKYISVKNIRFSLVDFLERIVEVTESVQTGSKIRKLIVCTFALMGLLKQLEIDLDEEVMNVCVALYQISKKRIVTDENVVEEINRNLEENDYDAFSKKEINDYLLELTKLGIVAIEDGKYEVVEKVVIW